MERLKHITIIFLFAVSSLGPAALAKPASVLLQEGLYAEEIEGDLDAAIEIYEQIITDSSAQRSHMAQAMYRQGMCYLKKQDERQVKAIFEKLIAQFSQETKIIEKVQPLLDELSNYDPAALMPPETLVYVEIGSPGHQVETIQKLLQGTPFENPLAAIGGTRGGKKSPGEKSPGEIMAALLNPSMMAEFKKIRGMAIGIMGISQNNPPLIAVLYPGKSDALRGIVLAGLGVLAQPGEPIEGMETLRIQNIAGVAYDDTVIIIAQPLERLVWCVKQYLGIAHEPTFTSNNRSFAKVSRQARQENALTVWANVDQVFAEVIKQFPEGKLPQEVCIADTVVDFESINDLVTFLSIQEKGIAVEANVGFNDGHRCLAYDLIRTPNLSRDGFKGVPSNAVALVSLALGESESSEVQAAQEAVKNLTGLDIGREIFANIEQITLFTLAPAPDTQISESGIPILSYFGLAVTSHHPEQTHQLLSEVLGIANVVANVSASEESVGQSAATAGEYLLPLGRDKQVYCYIGQAGKTTILAFSPEVLEASLLAIKGRRFALSAGPLQEFLNQMAPDTSKMVLVNVGGAIRAADAYINMAYDNPRNPVHKTFAQLAQACDRTCVQLRTGESVDNFNIHVSIDQLPPLDSVFPLVMQLSQADLTARAKATKAQPRDGTITGLQEDMHLNWKSGVNASSHRVYFGTSADELSLLAEVSKPADVKLPVLEEDGRYYWRVDEVWSDGSVITGDVWSFSIGKLIGWWEFDETEGNTASDSSGNKHVGTLVGDPQWQPDSGKVGGALAFDGDGDYVKIAKESDFDLTKQITVAAWIKAEEFGRERRAIVTKGGSAWRLHRNLDTNSIRFNITYGYQPAAIGKVNVNDGQWHHLVGTYDGARICLYVDGRLDNSLEVSKTIGTNNEPVYIGGHSEQAERCWHGLIDDVRIYNYALSPDEIAALCRVR